MSLEIGSGVLAGSSSGSATPESAPGCRAALRELPQARTVTSSAGCHGRDGVNPRPSWPKRNPPSVLTTADLLHREKRLDAGRAQAVAARVGCL
jgi:hypothetical protein